MWQSVWLSVLSCGSVCRSCVTVIARLASTHTALVSQSLVGLCFAFPSINQSETMEKVHVMTVKTAVNGRDVVNLS